MNLYTSGYMNRNISIMQLNNKIIIVLLRQQKNALLICCYSHYTCGLLLLINF